MKANEEKLAELPQIHESEIEKLKASHEASLSSALRQD